MSDMILAKRAGAVLAAFAIGGGLVLMGSGVASAAESHGSGSGAVHMGEVPGKASQAKDKTKIHYLAPEAPFSNAAKMTKDVPVANNVTEGFDHHLTSFHSVKATDYVQNNAEDPMGYSVGTHVDMVEDMAGKPHAFDKLQKQTHTTPKPEFQER